VSEDAVEVQTALRKNCARPLDEDEPDSEPLERGPRAGGKFFVGDESADGLEGRDLFSKPERGRRRNRDHVLITRRH
jgi:hypothetical protein